MALTVLSDSDVREVLDSLTVENVLVLQKCLRKALHEYSTGTQGKAASAMHQPERTVAQLPNGTTTLFMPAISSEGIGMKVITLPEPIDCVASSPKSNMVPHGSLTIMSDEGLPIGFLNAEEVTAFRTALSSSLLFCRRRHFRHLVVFGAGRQAFWHIRLVLLLRGHSVKTIHIINRTFSDRARDLLRDLYSIDQATKEHEGWPNTKFSVLTPSYGEYERLLKEYLTQADGIITTVPSTAPLFDSTILTSTEGRKRGRLIIAIGSYKPHMIEIPIEILHQAVKTSHEHRHFHKHAAEGGVVVVDTLNGCLKEAGEIIQAELTPHQLVEVGELVMLEGQLASPPAEPENVDPEGEQTDLDKLHAEPYEATESREPSLRNVTHEYGELSVASLDSSDQTSTNSRHSRPSSTFSRTARTSSKIRSPSMDSRKAKDRDDVMATWLRSGNVVYKSVGLGLMDLVVGAELVELAREKEIGTTIHNF